MATLLETSRVSPPPGAAVFSVPLAFLDIPWIHFHPIRRLLFYDHPCSKAYFLDTIVPNLKRSLSLTLEHYFPLSGNLIYPSFTTDEMPVFRYAPGDSVSFTAAESAHDFDDLIGNHARDADHFYHLVPEVPPVKDEPGCQTVPVMALRVTLFPGRGICVSYAFHHSLGDGSSIFRFMRAWASIAKHGPNEDFDPPTFERSFIKDPLGIDSIFWKLRGQAPLQSLPFPLPTNRVRATFILRQADIERLKDLVRAEKPALDRLSTFVVAASYVWVCLVKSGEGLDDDGPDFIRITVDIRRRVDPPLPENYYGNCLSYVVVKIERARLAAAGESGFVVAAEAIAEGIEKRLKNKDEVLKGVENWMSDMGKLRGMRGLGVAGSPKLDLAAADFGWGRAKKLEAVSIDAESYSMSLCSSDDGGLEVGMSLPEERMKAFGAAFARDLKMFVAKTSTSITSRM